MNIEKTLQQIEELRTRKANLEGRLAETMRTLQEEFGCSSLEEARELLDKMVQASARSEKKLAKMVEEFNERWKEVLDEDE